MKKKLLSRRIISIIMILSMFTTILAGQAFAEWKTNGPAGLEIYDIAVNPIDSKIVYVVSQTNTVYKSINSGKSFVAFNNGIYNDEFLQTVVIDLNYPDVVYACGKYLYRSEDAGQTWQQIGNGLPPCYNSIYCNKDILIDPTDSYIVYVATWAYDQNNQHLGGVYKSSYIGDSFEDITPSNVNDFRVTSIAIDADDHLTIYAGLCIPSGGENGGVWKSQDGGGSWTQFTHWAPEHSIYSVKADPNIPGRLFCGSLNQGCWRSDDYGDHWDLVLPNCAGESDIEIKETTVFYSCGSGIYRSFESGDEGSWSQLSNGVPEYGLCAVSKSETQEGLLFVGGALGPWYNLYKSTDNGDSFERIIVSNNKILDVKCVSSTTKIPSSTVYSGGKFEVNFFGGLFKTENNGGQWIQTMFPTWGVVDVAVCPDNPDIVLAAHWSDAADARPTLLSIDGGDHFNSVQGLHGIRKIVFDPINCNQVYAATAANLINRNHFYTSSDYGATWDPLYETGIPVQYNINSFIFNYLEGSDILYAGVSTHGVYKSYDQGETWIQIGLDGIEINSLSLCSIDGGGIVAGTNNGVYRTTDEGSSWQQIGLSGVEINDVFSDIIETHFIDHRIYSRPILWAATDIGVYEYIDGIWELRNDGLNTLEIRDLTLTKPAPYSFFQDMQMRLLDSSAIKDKNNKIESRAKNDGLEGMILSDDIQPDPLIRRSVLHAATSLGTYEYVFVEP